MSNSDKSSYKGIFKSTFLFSFVKVFQIVTGIIKNKVIAILLGAEGVGIIGILMNSVNLLQNGAGLGIPQSAVRDISEANAEKDKIRFSRIISLTKSIINFTFIFGIILTIALSPLLSRWTFGDNSQTLNYLLLAIVVGLNILTEGQLAILKGMRQLKFLAKASMIGSLVGLITAVPLYYFFGTKGIVPSLILTSISAVLFSNYFVKKTKYEKTKLTLKELISEASPMIKMGVALMLVTFIGLAFNLIIASYIRSRGGLEIVGYYRAGATIITSYFGIVLTAMNTDYYPRISAVYQDNIKLNDEVNKQAEVGLVLIFPIAVIFVFLSPLFINILYTKEFLQTISYTDYAILGTIIILCSNSLGMILLAKQAAKIFILSVLGQRIALIGIYFLLFNKFGILGLGVSYLIMGIIHFILMSIIIGTKYNIKFKKEVYMQLLIILTSVILAIILRQIDNPIISNVSGAVLIASVLIVSYKMIERYADIKIIEKINSIIKKKRI